MSAAGWVLESLLEDLEQQAAGLSARERDEDVDALGTAAWAEIDLASRLHGAGAEAGGEHGANLDIQVLGGRHLRGTCIRAGADFVVLDTGGGQWVVMTAAIAAVSGLGRRTRIPEARSLPSRLGVRSVLQRILECDLECVLLLRDATMRHGRPVRLGADFGEFCDPESRGLTFLVPYSSLAAVRL